MPKRVMTGITLLAIACSTPFEAAGQQETPGERAPQLQEVVVTAQKRSENLMDVPVPVSVINAQSLIDTNQLKLQDY